MRKLFCPSHAAFRIERKTEDRRRNTGVRSQEPGARPKTEDRRRIQRRGNLESKMSKLGARSQELGAALQHSRRCRSMSIDPARCRSIQCAPYPRSTPIPAPFLRLIKRLICAFEDYTHVLTGRSRCHPILTVKRMVTAHGSRFTDLFLCSYRGLRRAPKERVAK
jgi:hypothetical protein